MSLWPSPYAGKDYQRIKQMIRLIQTTALLNIFDLVTELILRWVPKMVMACWRSKPIRKRLHSLASQVIVSQSKIDDPSKILGAESALLTKTNF